MERELLDWVKDQLMEADMVLVGIGEEFEETDYLMQQPGYPEICEKIAEAKAQWVMPYVNHLFLEKEQKGKQAYQALGSLLADKNYFVLSVCMNGLVEEAGLKAERVVEPCGSYRGMQCVNGCRETLAPTEEKLLREVELCCRGEKDWSAIEKPVCRQCGAAMEFNSLYTEHYLEEGYQDKWNVYTKWLQGTVNRKLCILELGAGMMFAGVLRFRFEKIAGLNQKANLIRVHRSLCQIPEEIKERGTGISQNAVDFMAEMIKL